MAKTQAAADGDAPKKKGGKGKLIMLVGAILVVGGGGAGGALYAMQSGLIGGGQDAVKVDNGPHLVPKSEEKRASLTGDANGENKGSGVTSKAPLGNGGEKYASTYYTLDKEFTSNLKDSVHFVQVGIHLFKLPF